MKSRKVVYVASLVLCSGLSPAQTKLDLRSQSKSVDFSAAPFTRPVKTGTSMPATCTVGELFFLSNSVPGSNLYGCTATSTWTLLTGVGGTMAPGPANTFFTSDGLATSWRLFSAGPSGAVSMNFASGGATFDIDTAIIPRKAMSETISGLWTFSKGILSPPMAAPATPAEGQIFIDTATNTLKWYAGGAMRTVGSGGGDTFGASSTVAGQMTTFADTTGKLLGKYTGSGVLKASSGVVTAVTGSASDCVKVDGSSGACGSGGSLGPFTPQAPIGLLRDVSSYIGVGIAGSAYNVMAVLITVPYSFTVGRLATSIQTASASGKAFLGVYSPDGVTKHCEVQVDASTTGYKTGSCGTPVTLAAGSYYLAWSASDLTLKFHGISNAQPLEDGANAGTTAMYVLASNQSNASGLPASMGTLGKSSLVSPIMFWVLAN